MSDREELHGLRAELDGWRAKLEHLRVKANLGKMELRDKLAELGEAIEPARDAAKDKLTRLGRSGAEEAKTLARSLHAGWDALLETHRELSRKAGDERASKEGEER